MVAVPALLTPSKYLIELNKHLYNPDWLWLFLAPISNFGIIGAEVRGTS